MLVIGVTDNDLVVFASQQLDSKCCNQFDIVSYSVPTTKHSDPEHIQSYGKHEIGRCDVIDEHYDVLISIGLEVIQVMPNIPTYEEILFWDVVQSNNPYDAITDNTNFFLSKYVYGRG